MFTFTYLIAELVRHDAPIRNHLGGHSRALIGPIDSSLDHVLQSMIKVLQDISDGPDVKSEKYFWLHILFPTQLPIFDTCQNIMRGKDCESQCKNAI